MRPPPFVCSADILDFSRIEANKMVLHNATFGLDTVIEAAMEIAGLRAAQRRLQVSVRQGPRDRELEKGELEKGEAGQGRGVPSPRGRGL